MIIPFIGGAYTADSPNVNTQKSINCYPVVDNNEAKNIIALYGTPGLSAFSTLEAESSTSYVRGVHEFGSVLYVVVGANVYSVNSAGTGTLLGTITTNSTDSVYMADNGTQVIIVDGTANGHYISGGVLYDIADADFPAAGSVTFQDGYFIVTVVSTGRIYISGLYDVTTWDALDYATAEGNPDYATRVISNTHDLWIFGTKTVEVFYNSGATDFPFVRIGGAFLEIGLGAVASAIKLNGIIYWLTDKGLIVRNSGYQYQVISTDHIVKAISGYTSITDAIGWTYNLNGHDFYVLTFPTDKVTWSFDTTTGFWHEMQSYYNKDVAIPWSKHRGRCACMFGRKTIVGDYENGKLYELDPDVYLDNSQNIRRIRQTQIISKDNLRLVFSNLVLDFETGNASGTDVIASCTANLTAGVVTTVSVGTGGSGYLSTPLVRFSGGGGTGATATAAISGGAVTTVTVVSGGSGYTSAPTVSIRGGSADPQVVLEWSDDSGRTWSNQKWRSLGKIGEYRQYVRWNKLGQSRSRVFKVTVTDNVKFVLINAFAEIKAAVS